MGFDYGKQGLPPIHKRCGRECYLDSVRQKLIYITPEETVRQKVISYLIEELKVPKEMIAVEEHLSHYGIDSSKRADIVIHKFDEDKGQIPIVVIECKAPGVYLGDRSKAQMLDYCNIIKCDYAMMINDLDSFCFKYMEEKKQYVPIEGLPKYSEILEGKHTVWDIGELPPRVLFSDLEHYLEETFAEFKGDYFNVDISPHTEMMKAIPAFNLWEGLLDTRNKMPTGQYGLFRLIEDYGVRMLSYGNASGGSFYGPYRSFLIDVNGNTEIVSINVTTYWKGNNTSNAKTCLVVAVDNEKGTHHALQLVLDDNMTVNGKKCDFFHHGRIAIGNMGSGKIDELRMFVQDRYPQIISINKFYLGTLCHDRLWAMNDPEVIKLMENLISYALVRDEYRVFVKENKVK
jgi:hypothetical protein